eukprot:7935298-Alexandrium_andersonii.AAC.1
MGDTACAFAWWCALHASEHVYFAFACRCSLCTHANVQSMCGQCQAHPSASGSFLTPARDQEKV